MVCNVLQFGSSINFFFSPSVSESESGCDVIFFVGSENDVQRIPAHSWVLCEIPRFLEPCLRVHWPIIDWPSGPQPCLLRRRLQQGRWPKGRPLPQPEWPLRSPLATSTGEHSIFYSGESKIQTRLLKFIRKSLIKVWNLAKEGAFPNTYTKRN